MSTKFTSCQWSRKAVLGWCGWTSFILTKNGEQSFGLAVIVLIRNKIMWVMVRDNRGFFFGFILHIIHDNRKLGILLRLDPRLYSHKYVWLCQKVGTDIFIAKYYGV